MKNQRRTVLMLICVLTLGIFVMMTLQRAERGNWVSQGVSDLREKNFRTGSLLIALDGTWGFIWKDRPADRQILRVPGTWKGAVAGNEALPGTGEGEYQLKLRLPEETQTYAFYIQDVASAYRLTVNGTVIGENGRVSDRREDAVEDYSPRVIPFEGGGTVDVRFTVSNFDNNRGGLWASVLFGREPVVHAYYQKQQAVGLMMVAGIAAIGLFLLFIGAYLQRANTTFLFGMVCLLIALRIGVTGEKVWLLLLSGEPPWWLVRKLEYLTLYIAPGMYLLFLEKFLHQRRMPAAIFTLLGIAGALSLFVLLLPSVLFTHTLLLGQILAIVTVVYAFGVAFAEVRKGNRDAFWVMVTGGLVALTIFADVLGTNAVIPNYSLSTYAMLMFVMSTAMIIANQISRMYARQAAMMEETQRTLEENSRLNGQLLQANRELELHLYTDPLTGLYNRAYLEHLRRSGGLSGNLPARLMFGDVNGLKLVNDLFGHQRGDALLRAVAGVLRQAVRPEDSVFRVGGDEFLILLPRADEALCGRTMDRIRELSELAGRREDIVSIALGCSEPIHSDAALSRCIEKADQDMYRHKNRMAGEFADAFVQRMIRHLHNHMGPMVHHQQEIESAGAAFAGHLGWEIREVEWIGQLCQIHDIGLGAVPQAILEKNGPLTEDEWELVRQHPEKGYAMTRNSRVYGALASQVLTHHENWDGSGYPLGLRGEDIPKLARLMRILDAWDAMRYPKHYREGTLTEQQVMDELEAGAGSQFDPLMVREFLRWRRWQIHSH